MKTCKHCGADISHMHGSAVYCSSKCRNDAKNKREAEKQIAEGRRKPRPAPMGVCCECGGKIYGSFYACEKCRREKRNARDRAKRAKRKSRQHQTLERYTLDDVREWT